MDLISEYLSYTEETEPPKIYHRWSVLTAVGALLGRSCYIRLGHFRIFPNLYCMLIGEPATRKSTAIKISKKLLLTSGYKSFSGDKTRVEKFLADLAGVAEELGDELPSNKDNYLDSATGKNLWGDVEKSPREVYIAADEFNEFSGLGNADLFTTLGNLWDWDNPDESFTHRLKSSKSISIFQPTISILGGNTPENFSKAFPAEIIGNGFLSRLILIYGERSKRKYAFPPVPTEEETKRIVGQFTGIHQRSFVGELALTPEATELCGYIYSEWQESEDVRFRAYYQRRYTQMLKLAIIISRGRSGDNIQLRDILAANTILAAAEVNMSKALGEFGKSKISETTHKVLTILEGATRPLVFKDIWKEVIRDLDKPEQLIAMLNGLVTANRIQYISNPAGYLPLKKVKQDLSYVDFKQFLTEEEREML